MLFQYLLSYFHFFSYFVQPALILYAISYVSHFFTQVRFYLVGTVNLSQWFNIQKLIETKWDAKKVTNANKSH